VEGTLAVIVVVCVFAGVCRRHWKDMDEVTINMEFNSIIESYNRQGLSCGRGRLAACPQVGGSFTQSFAYVFMGEDQRPHSAQVFISAYMIAMDMGIDQEPYWLVGNLTNGGHDPVGQGRKLIIDQKGTVRSDKQTDITTQALKHVNIVPDLMGCNPDLAEIRLLGVKGPAEHQPRY